MIVKSCRVEDIRSAPNIDDLIYEYANESRIPEMPWPRTDWNTYETLERVGSLHVFSACQETTLVGFVFLIVSMMPEYGIALACTEAFFVADAYRHTGAGLKLLDAAENKAAELNAPGMSVGAPIDSRLAQVLPRRGFREVGRTFFKRRKDA